MRIVILTISDKHNDKYDNSKVVKEGGYCIAGFEVGHPDSWIRLLGKHDHYKITNEEAVYDNGVMCQPLDIIEVEAYPVDQNFIYVCRSSWRPKGNVYDIFANYPESLLSVQPENYYVIGKFQYIDHMSMEELLSEYYEESGGRLFGSSSNWLTVRQAEENKKSLQMIKVSNLELYPIEQRYGKDEYSSHYRARFDYNGFTYENITVTDPEYAADLNDYMNLSFGDTYLVVSLGERYYGKHYKLIAKIFDVVYTIENNFLKYFHAFRDCVYLQRYNNITRDLYQTMIKKGMKPCQECNNRIGVDRDGFMFDLPFQ